MTVGDLLQLPPVRGKLIFSRFYDKNSMKHLLHLQLWHLFKYAELTEDLRQNNKLFINVLNKVRVGNIDDDLENLLKARLKRESDKNCLEGALQVYAENKAAMERNKAVLNDFADQFYTIEAIEKISDNCKYPLALFQTAQNQKQTNTGGLAKLLKLKIGAKVMLTVNVDIHDRLINGELVIIRHTEFAQGSVCKVCVKFSDKQASSKAMRSSNLGRQNSWVFIQKCETEISIKKGSVSPSIRCTQFPLTLGWTSTVHKV